MKRSVWMFLLVLALPVTALASGSVEFSNSGGTLSGSNAGLTLTGSTLTVMGMVTGNLGSVSFTTGALSSGTLQMGAQFMGGGTFTIMGNGTNGVPNGPIFTGTFTGPVTWTLVTLSNGTHNYQLSGTVNGTWYTGLTVNGATVELTTNLGRGFFGTSVVLGGGETNIMVPEPGTLTLFGTGLVGLAGVLRRKLKV